MINWEKECKKLYKFILGITVLLVIALVMFILGFSGTTKIIQEKRDKIWQLETENEDLKEQVYQLERCLNK